MTIRKLAVAGVAAFAILQAVRPAIRETPATAEIQAPPEITHILNKDCYSCHSNYRRLSWFDEIVPAYWLVRYDILTARRHLNFSTVGTSTAAAQKSTLYEAVNMIELGAMPLPSFTKLHPDSRVTPQELATLEQYLAPWTAPLAAASVAAPSSISLSTVAPEPDGLAFDPTFESWKPISTTDRGDNNTLRFILGNEVAFKAAQSGNTSPWPDGTRFAKIAWQQALGADGLVHPGAFVQVELMVKDARRYSASEGWGWGRWRGADLKPYGKDAHFAEECTSCHQPMRSNDYVYTLPVPAANNPAGALPPSLPYQPLAWDVITMFVDPNRHTTATLYGNDVAMKSRSDARAVLALVTWEQRDDPHWFGARIPAAVHSVEFVSAAGYRRFGGAGLAEERVVDRQRASFILGLAPVWLP